MRLTLDEITEALRLSVAPRRKGDDDYDGSYHASFPIEASRTADGDTCLGGGGDAFYLLRFDSAELLRQFEALTGAQPFPRKLNIDFDGSSYIVDDKALPGAPATGLGKTLVEAIGSWMIEHQTRLGYSFELSEAAQPGEEARRVEAMAQR